MMVAEDLLEALRDTGWLSEAIVIEAALIQYRGSRAVEEGGVLSAQQIQADELDFVIDRMRDALFGGVHQRLSAQKSLMFLASSAGRLGRESLGFRFSEEGGFGSLEEALQLSFEAAGYERHLMSLIDRARDTA